VEDSDKLSRGYNFFIFFFIPSRELIRRLAIVFFLLFKGGYMVLNNKIFTVLKWILATAVAPTIALITGLGELYNFDPTLIVGTISLVATFLGALLGVSNYNYQKKKEER